LVRAKASSVVSVMMEAGWVGLGGVAITGWDALDEQTDLGMKLGGFNSCKPSPRQQL
jgi:hypothetical protein